MPESVKSLLEAFVDVFSKEFPKGLLPLRDVQHQIDLVPGTNLQITNITA